MDTNVDGNADTNIDTVSNAVSLGIDAQVACGTDAEATGISSTAYGREAKATGIGATAIGHQTDAGLLGTALAEFAKSTGDSRPRSDSAPELRHRMVRQLASVQLRIQSTRFPWVMRRKILYSGQQLP